MENTVELAGIIALTTALSSLATVFIQGVVANRKARLDEKQADTAKDATALAGYETLCNNLEERIDKLTKRLEAAEEKVNSQQLEIDRLREENKRLKERIAELETREPAGRRAKKV